ncbi:hypothetical protein Pint_27380 [Pistacia integerrima]|uniref:Uncharacterized protein n=1 Tax=Pistacia integerrima TaxID=434235 RepID=A0ACC0YUD9_9ROSI|nr:hypothetical protein Pint_27380 [Pistacia integerrima]
MIITASRCVHFGEWLGTSGAIHYFAQPQVNKKLIQNISYSYAPYIATAGAYWKGGKWRMFFPTYFL